MDAASRLANQISVERTDEALARNAVEALFLQNDNAGACQRVRDFVRRSLDVLLAARFRVLPLAVGRRRAGGHHRRHSLRTRRGRHRAVFGADRDAERWRTGGGRKPARSRRPRSGDDARGEYPSARRRAELGPSGGPAHRGREPERGSRPPSRSRRTRLPLRRDRRGRAQRTLRRGAVAGDGTQGSGDDRGRRLGTARPCAAAAHRRRPGKARPCRL